MSNGYSIFNDRLQCFFSCDLPGRIYSVCQKGQFEDDESPAVRILFDDERVKEKDETGDKDKDDKEIGENNKN